jgi:hypothetical protein
VFYQFKFGALLAELTEIDINVMDTKCTGRRIVNMETLIHNVDSWAKRWDEHESKIYWKFTRKIADEKVSKYYMLKLSCRNTSKR